MVVSNLSCSSYSLRTTPRCAREVHHLPIRFMADRVYLLSPSHLLVAGICSMHSRCQDPDHIQSQRCLYQTATIKHWRRERVGHDRDQKQVSMRNVWVYGRRERTARQSWPRLVGLVCAFYPVHGSERIESEDVSLERVLTLSLAGPGLARQSTFITTSYCYSFPHHLTDHSHSIHLACYHQSTVAIIKQHLDSPLTMSSLDSAVAGRPDETMQAPPSPENYTFPSHRLRTTMRDPSKTPLLLVACGSFSPITYLHLRMFEMAADYVRFNSEFEIVGGYLSPVSDAYKKAGLASAEHRSVPINWINHLSTQFD